MSTTAEKPDGYVVMTEVGLKGNEMASSKTRPQTDLQQNFFKGEPLALGITQILCGVFQIIFGIILDVHNTVEVRFKVFLYLTGVPFWSGTLYIISGSLSAAAARNPRIGLVRASLVMNIITAIFSAIAFITYIMHLVISRSGYVYVYDFCSNSEDQVICRLQDQARHVAFAVFCLLLILSILVFCISISTAVFACQAVCRRAFSEVSLVIFQTSSPQPVQSTISAVSPSIPDAHADQPSFKEFENP